MKSSYLYAMALMMASLSSDSSLMNEMREYKSLSPEEKEFVNRKKKAKMEEIRKQRGMKSYDFGDMSILALNRKNAERKYNNIKKMLNEKAL